MYPCPDDAFGGDLRRATFQSWCTGFPHKTPLALGSDERNQKGRVGEIYVSLAAPDQLAQRLGEPTGGLPYRALSVRELDVFTAIAKAVGVSA